MAPAPFRAGSLALAAALGAACWFAPAGPARADDEDDAREACREIAKNRDWKDVDAEVRREGEDRIVLTMTGERKGDERERRCVYNTKTNQARFAD